jgi:hypothetical protein
MNRPKARHAAPRTRRIPRERRETTTYLPTPAELEQVAYVASLCSLFGI